MPQKITLLLLLFLTLLFLSCGKQEEVVGGGQGDEEFGDHPTWTDGDSNDFWGKSLTYNIGA
jgi:hypothetical protein